MKGFPLCSEVPTSVSVLAPLPRKPPRFSACTACQHLIASLSARPWSLDGVCVPFLASSSLSWGQRIHDLKAWGTQASFVTPKIHALYLPFRLHLAEAGGAGGSACEVVWSSRGAGGPQG